jgi:hypothetical protein
MSGNFAKMSTSTLHLGIFYMPQICDKSLPKEGVLRIFSPLKIDGFGRV